MQPPVNAGVHHLPHGRAQVMCRNAEDPNLGTLATGQPQATQPFEVSDATTGNAGVQHLPRRRAQANRRNAEAPNVDALATDQPQTAQLCPGGGCRHWSRAERYVLMRENQARTVLVTANGGGFWATGPGLKSAYL